MTKLQQSFFNRTLSFVYSILKVPQMSKHLKEKTKAVFAFVSQSQCLLLIGIAQVHFSNIVTEPYQCVRKEKNRIQR